MTRDPDLVYLVRIVVLLLGASSLVIVLDLTLGTVFRDRRLARRRRRTAAAYRTLVAAIGPNASIDDVAERLREVPVSVVETALTVTARSIGGADALRLRAVAERLGVTDRARRRLGSRRWARRLRAVRVLRATSADAPATRALHDPVAEVRAAAVLWAGLAASSRPARDTWSAVDRPPVDVIDALADALLDPSALVRLAAKHAVTAAEPPLVAAVERALERVAASTTATEGRHRGTRRLSPLAPLAAATGARDGLRLELLTPFLTDDEPRVRAAAVRAVAAVAPDRIPELCDRHLDDEPDVRAAVAEVAGRDLASVRHLVPLAADPAYGVRQVARTSLRRAGPVGRALGRRVPRGGAVEVAS